MARSFISGLLLAAAGMLVVLVGDLANLDIRAALMGAAVGAVLGLVSDKAPLVRLGAFMIGFAVAWFGYALRAAALPDSTSGRMIAVGGVLLVITVICGLSAGHIPLWAALLGVVAITGAYELTYVAAPYNFLSESFTIASQVLLAVGAGYLAGLLGAWRRDSFVRDEQFGVRTDDAGIAVVAHSQAGE